MWKLSCSFIQIWTSKAQSRPSSRLSEKRDFSASTEVMVHSWCSQYPRTTLDSVPTPTWSQMCSQNQLNSITSCVVFALELLNQHLSSHHRKLSRLNLSMINFLPTHNIRMCSTVFTKLSKARDLEVSTEDISQHCLSNQPIKELDLSSLRIHRNSCKTTSHGKSFVISCQEPLLVSVQLCSITPLMLLRPTFKV